MPWWRVANPIFGVESDRFVKIQIFHVLASCVFT